MCVVRQMFKGTIDCAQISWTLFDLSIPEWSLLFFISMMTLGIYQLLRRLGRLAATTQRRVVAPGACG
jgi:disulfide bond formation protein DsbB